MGRVKFGKTDREASARVVELSLIPSGPIDRCEMAS